MNMEQPHPGVGGRHRETYTYGLSGNKLEEYLCMSKMFVGEEITCSTR